MDDAERSKRIAEQAAVSHEQLTDEEVNELHSIVAAAVLEVAKAGLSVEELRFNLQVMAGALAMREPETLASDLRAIQTRARRVWTDVEW